jgi:thiazole tautomerase (transcriptional regulator TenI)
VILCLVTDGRRRPVLEHCEDAIHAGVDLIQIREPGLEASALLSLAAAAVAIARGTPTRIVVNDRLDVAIASGAHGVHLRGDSIPPERARSMAPAGFLIGRSVHSADEAVLAARGADYVVAGTVFPTSSKPGLRQHLGLGGLAAIVRAVPVPVLAIGGVTVERIEAAASAGAAGIAAIGLLDAGAADLAAAAREARRLFDRAKSASS